MHLRFVFILLVTILVGGCATMGGTIEPKSYLYAAYNTMKGNFSNIEQALNEVGFEIRTHDFQVGVISTKDKEYEMSPTEQSKVDTLRVNINIHQDRNSVKLTISYLCGINDTFRFCTSNDKEAAQTIAETQTKVDRAIASAIK